jgi:hypothetical protein
VIIYLGTNDLADRYHLSATDTAQACASLVRVVQAADCGRGFGAPPVLLVCSPPLRASGPEATEYETVAAKSRTLGVRFADAAEAVAQSFSTSTASSATQKRTRCISTPTGTEHSRRQSRRSHAGWRRGPH